MPSHKNTDPAINRIKIVARGPSVGELSSQLIKWFISFTPPGITFTCTDCDHPFCIPRRLNFLALASKVRWCCRVWFGHQNLRDERSEAFTSLLRGGVYNYSYV